MGMLSCPKKELQTACLHLPTKSEGWCNCDLRWCQKGSDVSFSAKLGLEGSCDHETTCPIDSCMPRRVLVADRVSLTALPLPGAQTNKQGCGLTGSIPPRTRKPASKLMVQKTQDTKCPSNTAQVTSSVHVCDWT